MSNSKENFRQNVWRELEKRGWDQADLAAAAELSVPGVRKTMSGSRFSTKSVEAIAKALDTTAAILIAPPSAEGTPTVPKKLSDLSKSDLKDVVLEAVKEGSMPTPLSERDIEALSYAHKIPMDILRLLSAQGGVYFNSLRRELQLKTAAKLPAKKSKNQSN